MFSLPVAIPRRALLRLFGVGAAALTSPAHAAAEKDADVWSASFDTDRVFAHVDRHSIIAGESFGVFLSRKPGAPPMRGSIVCYRVGDYPWGRREVWRQDDVEVTPQPLLHSAAATGTGWNPNAIVSTGGWEPGVYTIDMHEVGENEPYYNLAQIILRPAAPSGDVLVKLGTNTWQAYNSFGGHSLYPDGDDPAAATRGAMVSFDRPCHAAFYEYEVFLVRWLEHLAAEEGFRVEYASNFDVHAKPGLLDSYRLVICGSHDEYWSAEEFDAFEQRIFERGGHTFFFGANTAYWQVRYVDIDRPPDGPFLGRQMVCHKSARDPVARRVTPKEGRRLMTARFREDARRPESMLMGSAYQDWFQPSSEATLRVAYEVVRGDGPLFEGTGLKAGDTIADVVGYEWDCRDPQGDGARLWNPRKSMNAGIHAAAIEVLFTGAPVSADGRRGLAEAVMFTSPAGARVFNAGSIRWAWGLGRPGFESAPFKRFNRNLVTSVLAR